MNDSFPQLISVSEAESILKHHPYAPSTESVSLQVALDRTLSEDIFADRDIPPFHRVMMDGIAIQHAALVNTTTFLIQGTQAAGSPPLSLYDATHCIEVMTGAAMPLGADLVIPYEHIQAKPGVFELSQNDYRFMQNIQPRGFEYKAGEVLLEKGIKLGPTHIAILASVGKNAVWVKQLPRVAILSTGDELVEVDQTPLDYQLRHSNREMLRAMCTRLGLHSTLFHVNDNERSITEELPSIIEGFDIILITGGISKGKFDFIPSTLKECGVSFLFQKIKQKPGKPFLIGRKEHRMVFAFPGNPSSVYTCAVRYFLPWYTKNDDPERVKLASPLTFKPGLTQFVQVKLERRNHELWAHPSPGKGSGDYVQLGKTEGFVECPSEREHIPEGEVLPFYRFP